ncbi:hypothetical protein POX_h09443 [Penicillium oxalicum]|uniref:Uncharacterized protein n=1 Tax=Penicillium oxalicum (strain 114-2 / CGMCC 5302) TaxID=933388 RepID=S7ZLE0_PENO1|nr:hypothetical protein POX_h09443 [Penicillium oxalicum]EPS31144.1 hypothetical protein PDE_06099 [Penicillium oxalicum 114-2]KAI2785685.1 hypothetical protein POX_h09443 [Penicillium oxalicum]
MASNKISSPVRPAKETQATSKKKMHDFDVTGDAQPFPVDQELRVPSVTPVSQDQLSYSPDLAQLDRILSQLQGHECASPETFAAVKTVNKNQGEGFQPAQARDSDLVFFISKEDLYSFQKWALAV